MTDKFEAKDTNSNDEDSKTVPEAISSSSDEIDEISTAPTEGISDISIDDNLSDDEECLKDLEKDMTPEEMAENRTKAIQLKSEGNELYKSGAYSVAIRAYTAGLKTCPTTCSSERAILYANRAAAKIKLDSKKSAIHDCTKAIKLNPVYTKAILRRAKLYEDTEKFDESLEDFKKLLEIEPDNREGLEATVRLPPKIEERNEKLKAEMVGKLKDLGNMILKPFGLSTNNFQMQQDPATGSYSINFKQN